MKGKFTRISTCTNCLGLACLLLTGNVLAGTTATTVVELGDCLQGDPDRTITIPANAVTREIILLRDVNEDLIMRVTLGGGLEFDGSTLPTNGDLTLSVAAGGVVQATIVAGGADLDAFVDYFVDITTGFSGFPTLSLDTTGWTLRDTINLLAGGGIATITVKTFNAADNSEVDSGIDTVDWLNVAGDNCPPPLTCMDIADLTETSMAGALRSEERVVARLEQVLRRAETIAEVRTRDIDRMLADLADAIDAIEAMDGVNDSLDLAEAFQCLASGELLLIRPDILVASALDTYVSSRLEASSEVTLQTLLNLMGRAIEHKENAMESLISFGFF